MPENPEPLESASTELAVEAPSPSASSVLLESSVPLGPTENKEPVEEPLVCAIFLAPLGTLASLVPPVLPVFLESRVLLAPSTSQDLPGPLDLLDRLDLKAKPGLLEKLVLAVTEPVSPDLRVLLAPLETPERMASLEAREPTTPCPPRCPAMFADRSRQ